jgi:hypothetical protein
MTNFLKSKVFLAILGGLSVFRFIALALGILLSGYGVKLSFILVVLTVIAQTVIFFGLLAKNQSIKIYKNGIRLAFLLGLLGNFVLGISNFIQRRNFEIPLNPLEILSPIISIFLPIMNFYEVPMDDTFLVIFWLPNLILYYGLFVAALILTVKKDDSGSTPVSQNVKKQPAQVNRAVSRGDDLSSQIIRLKELYDNGTLSEEEFKKAKSKLLS